MKKQDIAVIAVCFVLLFLWLARMQPRRALPPPGEPPQQEPVGPAPEPEAGGGAVKPPPAPDPAVPDTPESPVKATA